MSAKPKPAKKAITAKKVAAKKVAAKKCVILQVESLTGEPLGNSPAKPKTRTHVEAAAAMMAKAAIAEVDAFYEKRDTAAPAPKQSRSHPTLEAWLSRPEHVIRLKQILADPVFVAACHYVEATVSVTPDDLVGAKAALDEVIVRKTALATGVRIFTTTIAALPNFRKRDTTAEVEPWSHIQAPIR